MKTVKIISSVLFLFFFSSGVFSQDEAVSDLESEITSEEKVFFYIHDYGIKQKSTLSLISAVEMYQLNDLNIEGVDVGSILAKAEQFANNDASLITAVKSARNLKARGKTTGPTGINLNNASRVLIAGGKHIERSWIFNGATPAELKVIDNLGVGVGVEVYDKDGKRVAIKTKDCNSYTYVTWTPPAKQKYRIVVKNINSSDDIRILMVTN